MRRISLLLATILIATAWLGTAAAQTLADPLLEHVDGKLGDAQDDPVAFLTDHASEDGIERELDWTTGYTCFAAREAANEAGQEPPDLGVCPRFETVHEVDEKDVVAESEELDRVVAEAQAILDDAVATVDEILDEPTRALDALLGFVDRTLRAIQRIIDDLVHDAVTLLLVPARAHFLLMDAAADAADALWDAVAWTGGKVAGGATTLATGAAAAWNGATGALGAAVDAVKETTTQTASSIRDAVASLFTSDPVPRVDAPGPDETVNDGTESANELLDDVTRLVRLQ